jgi:hypothetical protein
MTWLRQGLGFYLDRLEKGFDQMFGLETGKEFCEFEINALLRPDFKTRIDGLAKAVQGGVFSPNEARAQEGLPRAEGGDEPRVQQQLVALSWEPPEPAPPMAPPVADDDDDEDKPKPDDGDEPADKPASRNVISADEFRSRLRARTDGVRVA